MVEVDLLGDPIIPAPGPPGKRKRKTTKPWGYFAPPGTGPAGHTCGDCVHHYVKRMAKDYHKCLLSRAKWTGGGGSDIRVRSPSCSAWEAEKIE